MSNESKTPEEYLSDALDLMVKAKWVKQYGPGAKGFGVAVTLLERNPATDEFLRRSAAALERAGDKLFQPHSVRRPCK